MEEQKSGNNKKAGMKRHPILIITTICVVAAAALGGLITYILIGRYEKGIIEVCATQQDAYVQLVLDQINLKDNRDDEEIINDILKTMDSSSNNTGHFLRTSRCYSLRMYWKPTDIRVCQQIHIIMQDRQQIL